MKEYKNILIAAKCKKDFEPIVGVYLINGSMQLIGEAQLRKNKKNIYADFKVEVEIDEYYPEVKFINIIDSIVLYKKEGKALIKSIGEQLL